MKFAALFLTIFALILPQVAFADDSMQATTMQGQTGPVNGTAGDKMVGTNATFQLQKKEMKDAMVQGKQDMKADLQQKRADFKAKLQIIKDEHKKTVADSLNTRLATINKSRTDIMTANITKLTEILALLKSAKDKEKAAGHDVTAVETAITAADTALTTAQTAVTAQAAKDYTATITDETTLKTSFGTEVSQLRTDLAATHKTVVDAKQAVKGVASALHQVGGGDHMAPSGAPSAVPSM